MGWISKLMKLATFAIILAVMAGLGFIIFADPNNHKPRITQLIKTYTGLPLKINGKIEWIIRPEAVIKLQDVVLESTTDATTPAAQIKNINLKLELASLLRNNVMLTDFVINSPVINWKQTKDILNQRTTSGKHLTIQNLNLKNGTFIIQDPDDHINWTLNNVTFAADSFTLNSGQELPSLDVEGELINVNNNTHYILETTAKFDLAQHTLTLDPLKMVWNDTLMQGNAVIQQYDTDPTISGNFALPTTDIGLLLRKLDPYFANTDIQIDHSMQIETNYAYAPKDSILDLTKFNLQIDDGSMTGHLKLGFNKPYHAEFDLDANNLNFSPLGLLGNALFPATQKMTSFPIDFLKEIVVEGKFNGAEVTFNDDIAIDKMHLEVRGDSGVIQFSPVIINAYGGMHDIGLHIDATGEQLAVQINEQASQVDLQPWLKLVDGHNLITGTTDLQAQLKGQGNNITELKNSLNGEIYLSVNDGALFGVDASKLMQFSSQTVGDIFKEVSVSPAANANVLAIKQSSNWIQTQVDNPKTTFNNLELSIAIENGTSKTATLAIHNNQVKVQGTGSLVLRDHMIDFNTTIMGVNNPSTGITVLDKYIKQTPLSMTITGSLDRPVFGPNVQSYVTSILQKGTAELQQQVLTKMLNATPVNAKTDKTATEIFLNSLQSLNR